MKRDIGIDFIKFLAAFLITNSHMDKFYPPELSILGTGGAIGDALFFFCSGFTLFLKPMPRFDNWYRKRINRIFPSVFAWSIISAFVFGISKDMKHTILLGGGWFVACIMMYYVVLWVVDRIMKEKLILSFILVSVFIIITYIFWDRPDDFNMYGYTYYKWIFFFIIMLFGAIIGKKQYRSNNTTTSLIMLFANIIIYYAIMFASNKYALINDLQIISLIPLLLTMYYTYSLSNSKYIIKLFNIKQTSWIIMFIGGLCLEIYLTQGILLTYKLNIPFPLNYITTFIGIIVCAYITRCASRFFSQTFGERDYDWKKIFKAL